MNNRRDFLKQSLLGAGAMALMNAPQLAAANGKPLTRFIFMHRGNGLWPRACVPPSLDAKTMELEKRKEAVDVDLDGHDLPQWLGPLAGHRENLTILQGLSGKMCTTGHHSWCSSLGVFKANERLSSIKWATVDFELAKLFPSPAGHIELACFPLGGGNARGSLDGVATGFSARGPQQPNYAFGSPRIALQELFKSVSTDSKARTQYQLDRKVLEFIAGNESAIANPLIGIEKAKVQNYADSVESIRERNRKIDAMAEVIRKHVPKLDAKYLDPNVNTLDRQIGHSEVLLGALISGLTNVVAFTVDELGHRYTGIPGIEGEKVNMHDVGHNKSIGGLSAETIRERARTHHMKVIDRIVKRLKSVPEGDGTMFDNTMLFYFPDGGETHHSHGWEYPFIILSGDNARVDLRRRYIRLPNYGQPGHSTLGNFYTTLLNAYGNPIEHYGALDTGLTKFGHGQTGPIKQFQLVVNSHRQRLGILLGLCVIVGWVQAAQPKKQLPFPGEVFAIEGRTAFLILPDTKPAQGAMPWVWYAPTLRGLPGRAEKWMFERFLKAGIAIAGVDVGESYGSPKGRATYAALHQHLVEKRGLAKRACLLARSRGGLMLYSWAAENPDKVACITGIYPVCNIASYPGVQRASGAFGLTAQGLEAQLAKHNPIDRLAPLAKAKVPIFHIHGDMDRVVPLDKNSAIIKARYDKLGGPMTLEVVKGQGHNMWPGWLQSQALVDFVLKKR